MKNQDLHDLFVDELSDIYNAENQIVESLPGLIKLVSLPALKEAFTQQLRETENQIQRLDRIISILNLEISNKTSEALEGLLRQTQAITQSKSRSPTLDAGIISCAQKCKHYKIAAYGALRSFAKQLQFDSEVIDLFQETLDEVGAADKKLTKIAEGSLFTTGVNKEAATAGPSFGKKSRY